MAKVLIVDDAPDVVKILAHALKEQEYEVIVAYSGREALSMVAAERPDAVLMDIMMPGVNGIDACRQLKADAELGMIPIILVTARDLPEDIANGLDAGADDYVTKPFNKQVLIARLRAAIRIKESRDSLAALNDKLRSEIVERQRVEDALRKKDEDLRQAQKLEAIGRLGGGIAHEFNNLLQVILGYACSAMENLGPDDDRHQDLEQVLKAGGRAATLTRQLLGFSRRQQLARRSVDPNQVVADLDRMIRPFVGEHIQLELDLSPDVGTVDVDPEGLEQVLLNLCLNSRDAMPEGGKLTIRTDSALSCGDVSLSGAPMPAGRQVRISISDTGDGMPPEVQEHIFEPFYTTKEVGKGTGLGLATAYGIVRQHGGTIQVSSEVGKGTTFTICLPVVDRQPDAHPSKAETPAGGGTETVLLAEDEPLIREFAARKLEKAGYTVLAVSNGEDAWHTYEENRNAVSLVLLDMIMPKMTGHQVWERIKADNPEAKGIFCTGYDPDAATSGLAEEANLHVIAKPFDTATLLRTVREALDNGRSRRQDGETHEPSGLAGTAAGAAAPAAR